MTDSLGSGLLDHARRLLDSLQLFHSAYFDYNRGDGSGGFQPVEEQQSALQAMENAWDKMRPICMEAGKSTLREVGELADWIRDAAQWCKRFSDAVNEHGFGEAVFHDRCDGIMRIVQSGRQMLEQCDKQDDPFSFLKDGESKGNSNDAEPSVANPLQILSAGNAAIGDAQKAVSDTLAAGNQALSHGELKGNADRRVESKFPKPDDSLTDDAIDYLKKSFHKLPHAGTAQVNHVIAAAVKDGIQRNAVEWAMVRMQECGWIELSIPSWDEVIGSNRSEPSSHALVREQKRQWYFGTQEYDLRLTEYFYNPAHCVICSKLLDDYDYDRSECHDCRSPQGKLADLYVAIHASGDSPDRIREWPMIRALLTDAFGPDRTIEELWELMTDRLRVNGWDKERWLRTKYGDFIELLKAGLLNGQSVPIKDDAAMSSMVEGGERALPAKPVPLHTLEACKPSERQAYYSYKLAEAWEERRLEDREAYDLLVEDDWSERFTGELADYKLPKFGTWARQLRTARKASNERKYTSRTHR